jgi:peptidoglycan hydrolase-like protein with peptidoglycan-binding domain
VITLIDAGEPMELETTDTLRPTLRRGATGSVVRDLQARLASNGFSAGPVDGNFGSATEQAAAAFQRSRGLVADGVVGALTWAALAGQLPVLPAAPATTTTTGVSLNEILAALARKRYVVFTRPYELNIVGVRSANAQPDRFDDAIHVFFKDSTNSWTSASNAATTDPGKDFLHDPMNVKGTAIVMPGQYRDSHQIGLHNKQYTALVQRGPITVARDYNEDDRLDFNNGRTETGVFGINIHRASATGTSSVVGRYSAGCQVFASSADFARFMEWCQRHSKLYGNHFTYTLLVAADLKGSPAVRWGRGGNG